MLSAYDVHVPRSILVECFFGLLYFACYHNDGEIHINRQGSRHIQYFRKFAGHLQYHVFLDHDSENVSYVLEVE